jgi:serine/threonine-protein kinase
VTPQAVDTATSQVVTAAAPAAEEGAEHRDRLQRALGEGLKIRRLLGRGGFAEVWSAFDVRLKREVAVKTLRYDLLLSETLLQRFQREAEAVAKLRHPNIIPIYEVGEGEGLAYFVMPMIEGESLAEALEREGSFSVEETCRILREAAGALAAAHRAGIVHRDVKPDNIMLEGPERRPIVMDFGIAKATTGGDVKLTGTGMAMGTPHYMSPEQASGEKNVAAPSDQYALALVGYRMLTGQLPFDADTMPSLIMKQIVEVPKPVAEVRPGVPRELSDALARALSKDPATRFPTMEEFAAAIPHAGGAPSAAMGRRRPTATELARFPGAQIPSWREPLVIGGIVGALLSVALFGIAHLRSGIATAAQRSDATFIGRAFLTKQGANAAFDERVTLVHDDSASLWLQRAIGTNEADRRARLDGSLFRWGVRWQREGAGGVKEAWSASVAPNRQIARFTEELADTATGQSLAADSARHIAETFLRGVGLDPASLTRVQDSAVQRPRRTDRLFVWEASNARVIGRQGDTAVPTARVNVVGTRVQDFRYGLQLPKAFLRDFKESSRQTAAGVTVVIIVLVLVISAIALTVQRQRTDDLQWKASFRISIAALAFLGASMLQNPRSFSSSSLVASFIAAAFLGLLTLFGLLFGVVSAESLANEVNQAGLVGFQSLARWRTTSPEWPAAILRGFAAGALLVGVDTLTHVIAGWRWWRDDGLPDNIDLPLPWSMAATTVGSVLVMTVVLFFGVHLAARYARRWWVALIVAAVFGTMTTMVSSFRPWTSAVDGAVSMGFVVWTTWRFGFLTTAVTLWVMEVLSATIALFAIGADVYLAAAVVSTFALAATLGFALLRTRAVQARS